MKKLNFSYDVKYSFSSPVSAHSFSLRILPRTNEEQGIYAVSYRICGSLSRGGTSTEWEVKTCGVADDGFGNRVVSGRMEESHDGFSFSVSGKAYTDRSRPQRWQEHPGPMYRFPTALTQPGKGIYALWKENREKIHGEAAQAPSAPGGEARRRACLWMHLVAASFAYEAGRTDIRTDAETALAGGAGVCQDYAQILITLLRMDQIPARYVAGLMIGEGATHAWCEAWCDGYWISLDPTHDRELDGNYIAVAVGRDYADCSMERGSFQGLATQTQDVQVQVTENIPGPLGRWDLI